jgi:hypothetical protein
MIALWNRFMQYGPWFDVVPFKYGDRLKVIGEHPCGHQTRQAATDNHSVLTEAMSHYNLLHA